MAAKKKKKPAAKPRKRPAKKALKKATKTKKAVKKTGRKTPSKKKRAKTKVRITAKKLIRKKDAPVVQDEYLRLQRLHGGAMTPRIVLNAARDKKNILHRYFDWNDAKAAGKYRLYQARQLILAIQYEVETSPDKVFVTNAHVNVTNGGEFPGAPRGRVYVSKAAAIEKPTLVSQMLDEALDRLKLFKQEYEIISVVATTLKPVFLAIAKVERAIKGRTAKRKKTGKKTAKKKAAKRKRKK